jgi:hypothetical protein
VGNVKCNEKVYSYFLKAAAEKIHFIIPSGMKGRERCNIHQASKQKQSFGLIDA